MPNENVRENKLLTESFLMSILNSIADPIFVKDSNHNWILINDSFCNFIGHPRENLLGKSDYEFFPKEQADVFWKKDEETMKSGETNTNEETLTDSQGKVKTILTKKSVYSDILGHKYIVGIIRDITKIKEVEIINKNRSEELERINKLMVGREQKMIELKNELETLRQRLENCEKTKS